MMGRWYFYEIRRGLNRDTKTRGLAFRWEQDKARSEVGDEAKAGFGMESKQCSSHYLAFILDTGEEAQNQAFPSTNVPTATLLPQQVLRQDKIRAVFNISVM